MTNVVQTAPKDGGFEPARIHNFLVEFTVFVKQPGGPVSDKWSLAVSDVQLPRLERLSAVQARTDDRLCITFMDYIDVPPCYVAAGVAGRVGEVTVRRVTPGENTNDFEVWKFSDVVLDAVELGRLRYGQQGATEYTCWFKFSTGRMSRWASLDAEKIGLALLVEREFAYATV